MAKNHPVAANKPNVFDLDVGRVNTRKFARLGALARVARRYQRWNWAWRMEIALRYQPVANALANLPADARILDVGCGSKGGVTAYVNRPAFGVDVTFDRERLQDHPRLTPLVGSGTALPLEDASVDAAITLDTLEHLTPADRAAVVAEMARVVKNAGVLVVGAPCGEEARRAEQAIAAEFAQKTGRVHPKLGEHLEHDAWTSADLRTLVEKVAANRFTRFELVAVPNVNVGVWLFFRRLFDLGQPVPGLTHVQRVLLQPFFRFVAPRVHREPTYRHVIVVKGSD